MSEAIRSMVDDSSVDDVKTICVQFRPTEQDDSSWYLLGYGKTLLSAVADVNEKVVEYYCVDLSEDALMQGENWLEQLNDSGEYQRYDFGEPESSFKLTVIR